MKRYLVVLAAICLATGAFAAGVSVGVAVSGTYYSQDLTYKVLGFDGDTRVTEIPWNFSVFVDSPFLQVAVGYKFFSGADVTTTFAGSSGTSHDKSKYSYVTFAGYGKFPIPLGAVTIIPMLGVEYDLTVSAVDDAGVDFGVHKGDLNALWIKGGIGAEIAVNPAFYIRPELLIGYQLNNQSDRDSITFYENNGADAGSAAILTLSAELAVLFGVRL